MKNLKSIAYPIRDIKDMPWKQEYQECGTRLTHPYSNMMATQKISKDLMKLIVKTAKAEMHKEKQESGSKTDKPLIVYRDAAARQLATRQKPRAVVLFTDGDVKMVELHNKTKEGFHILSTQVGEHDNFIKTAINSMKTTLRSSSHVVWNLGENPDAWPKEVVHITQKHIERVSKQIDSTSSGVEQYKKIMADSISTATKELEALDICVAEFLPHFVSAVHISMTSTTKEAHKQATLDYIAHFQTEREERDLAKAA